MAADPANTRFRSRRRRRCSRISIARATNRCPIRIDKEGRWAIADRPPTAISAAEVIEQARLEAARPVRGGREVHLVARPERRDDPVDRQAHSGQTRSGPGRGDRAEPRRHLPGAARAVRRGRHHPGPARARQRAVCRRRRARLGGRHGQGDDEAVSLGARGLPDLPVPRRAAARVEPRSRPRSAAALEQALGFPMFVKPANLGSSVGISKAKNAARSPRRWISPAASTARS